MRFWRNQIFVASRVNGHMSPVVAGLLFLSRASNTHHLTAQELSFMSVSPCLAWLCFVRPTCEFVLRCNCVCIACLCWLTCRVGVPTLGLHHVSMTLRLCLQSVFLLLCLLE